VHSYGGFVKQYQVQVDPYKLHSYKLSLNDVVTALATNNANAGANFIENAGEEVIIRGMGRIDSIDDINNILLKSVDGIPITIERVAHGKWGFCVAQLRAAAIVECYWYCLDAQRCLPRLWLKGQKKVADSSGLAHDVRIVPTAIKLNW
jgi:cobalt-zinc-cadmium resistance protein CzcA